MLVNTIEMLQKAKKEKYAIPHFNINNFVSGNANLQSNAITLTELHIKIQDIIKEVKKHAK